MALRYNQRVVAPVVLDGFGRGNIQAEIESKHPSIPIPNAINFPALGLSRSTGSALASGEFEPLVMPPIGVRNTAAPGRPKWRNLVLGRLSLD